MRRPAYGNQLLAQHAGRAGEQEGKTASYSIFVTLFAPIGARTDTGRITMETRIAIIGIIVEDVDVTGEINDILHDYSMYIIGRMGIPYRERDVNIISIVLDAPNDVINALAGKIGRVKGVSSKTIYSKI